MHRLLKLRYYAAKWLRTWCAIDARRAAMPQARRDACAHEIRMIGGGRVVCGSCGAVIEETPIAELDRLHAAIGEVPPRRLRVGVQARVHDHDLSSHVLERGSFELTHVSLTERGVEPGGKMIGDRAPRTLKP